MKTVTRRPLLVAPAADLESLDRLWSEPIEPISFNLLRRLPNQEPHTTCLVGSRNSHHRTPRSRSSIRLSVPGAAPLLCLPFLAALERLERSVSVLTTNHSTLGKQVKLVRETTAGMATALGVEVEGAGVKPASAAT